MQPDALHYKFLFLHQLRVFLGVDSTRQHDAVQANVAYCESMEKFNKKGIILAFA